MLLTGGMVVRLFCVSRGEETAGPERLAGVGKEVSGSTKFSAGRSVIHDLIR